MKSIFRTIACLGILGLFLLGCSKERRVAKRLDGSWIINSYIITQDSTEQELEMLGLLFSKGTLEFEAYDLSNSIGDFEMNLKDILLDSFVVTSGVYSLSENGEELTLTIGNEDNITDIDANKERIIIEGVIDEATARIEADRL